MLKPSPIRRKPIGQRTAILKSTPMARSKKAMKSRGPKMTPIRKAARGQDCTLQLLGVCNGDSSTVVLCHSNKLEHGKGIGLKAPDEHACFGCSACHDVLDGRVPRPEFMTKYDVDVAFDHGVLLTHAVLRKEGVMP